MANSKFQHVKIFERESVVLHNCWFVVRIDGHAFTEFSTLHNFEKPNDARALDLMTKCAVHVMTRPEFSGEICLAYGQSDEYSFVFRRSSALWGRREAKIVTNLVSLFAAAYVLFWSEFFAGEALVSVPGFDGRVVCYPTDSDLQDYLAWRQVDCHINNQYNTCFWHLVNHGGKSKTEAAEFLKGTQTPEKNEYLFKHNVNYNELPDVYRKGTIVIKKPAPPRISREEARRRKAAGADAAAEAGTPPADAEKAAADATATKTEEEGATPTAGEGAAEAHGSGSEAADPTTPEAPEDALLVLHEDLISPGFWEAYPHILVPKRRRQTRTSPRKRRVPRTADGEAAGSGGEGEKTKDGAANAKEAPAKGNASDSKTATGAVQEEKTAAAGSAKGDEATPAATATATAEGA